MHADSRATPGFLPRLDRLHAGVRESALLYRFTLATRILLAAGFIPTGMVKLLGQRFTRMDTSSDIGLFFEVMYQSGEYWRFIGAAQIVAGILMLIPRTALLGAMIFLPVIANIFVITLSYDFKGTPVVTGLMLLATVYLLCWDWHRVRGIVWDAPPAAVILPVQRLSSVERGIYAAGVASGFVAFFAMRSLVPPALMGPALLAAAAAALAALVAFAIPRISRRAGTAGTAGA